MFADLIWNQNTLSLVNNVADLLFYIFTSSLGDHLTFFGLFNGTFLLLRYFARYFRLNLTLLLQENIVKYNLVHSTFQERHTTTLILYPAASHEKSISQKCFIF